MKSEATIRAGVGVLSVGTFLLAMLWPCEAAAQEQLSATTFPAGSLAAYTAPDPSVCFTDVPPAGSPPAAPVVHGGYTKREKSAPAAVKTTLAQLRAQISAGKRTHAVGYTKALDRSLKQLTGLTLPADAKARARAHGKVQTKLVQADALQKSEYLKKHPGAKIVDSVAGLTATMARVDFRTKHKVTPIRDQGICASCWAFSTAAAFESSNLIRNGLMADSAEQAIVSCSKAGSCAIGYAADALDWLATAGTAKEADYPYVASSGSCHAFTPAYFVSAWGYVRPDGGTATTAQLKQALVTYGPIISPMLVTDQIRGYTCGVVDEPAPSSTVNHFVVIVGWDDNAIPSATRKNKDGTTTTLPGKGAWIVRNSWGKDWGTTANFGGERGYMYLAYGSSNVGYMAPWVQAANTTYGVSSKVKGILQSR